MKRRTFISMALGGLLLSSAMNILAATDYTPGLIKAELDKGKTLLVDYAADWCSTCARQERVLTTLRDENPAYNEKISFIRVDWDTYDLHEVTTSRNIPRRSTLILLRGDKELGRIVAGTGKAQIKELLDKAL